MAYQLFKRIKDNTVHIGDQFEIRRGRAVVGYCSVKASPSGNMNVEMADSQGRPVQTRTYMITSSADKVLYCGDFYGCAFYKEVPDPKEDADNEKTDIPAQTESTEKVGYNIVPVVKPPKLGQATDNETTMNSAHYHKSAGEQATRSWEIGDSFILKSTFTSKLVALVNFSVTNAILRDMYGKVLAKVPVEDFQWSAFTRGLGILVTTYKRNDHFANNYRKVIGVQLDKKLKRQENVQNRLKVEPLCPNGAKAIPEVPPEPTGQWIIWAPDSNTPPRKILKNITEGEAQKIAEEMYERHNKRFYWCQLKGFVEPKKTTTVTISKEITHL